VTLAITVPCAMAPFTSVFVTGRPTRRPIRWWCGAAELKERGTAVAPAGPLRVGQGLKAPPNEFACIIQVVTPNCRRGALAWTRREWGPFHAGRAGLPPNPADAKHKQKSESQQIRATHRPPCLGTRKVRPTPIIPTLGTQKTDGTNLKVQVTSPGRYLNLENYTRES